jgi:hypothetical protein
MPEERFLSDALVACRCRLGRLRFIARRVVTMRWIVFAGYAHDVSYVGFAARFTRASGEWREARGAESR